MSFMEPEIYEGRVYALEDANGGTYYVPFVEAEEPLTDYVPSGAFASEPVVLDNCVIGRLSAPGYLDCTDWTPYETVEAAEAALAEELGEDEDEDDTFDDEG